MLGHSLGLRWLSRLSDILPPLRSRVRALYRASAGRGGQHVGRVRQHVGRVRQHVGRVRQHVGRVRQHSSENREFSPVSSHMEI